MTRKHALRVTVATVALVSAVPVAYVAPRAALGAATDTPRIVYVDRGSLNHKLAGNDHTPATAGGSFRKDASIDTPDVIGVTYSVVPAGESQ